MIMKRLLDIVSCELKKKMFKERGPVEAMKVQWIFLSTQDLLSI